MADLHRVEESPQSMPLQLSGFLQGDTIQVEGDSGSLQFSMRFNIHKKNVYEYENHFNYLGENSLKNHHTFENTSLSSYMTPNSNHKVKDGIPQSNLLTDENNEILETGELRTRKRDDILTRLRSGAITPVKYFTQISAISADEKLRSLRNMNCGTKEKLLESVIRRHSLPVRPCTSYIFFVMANWGSVKNSSFGEASRTLGQMWRQLCHKEKKVFMEMALKDSARYKRQCTLLGGKSRKKTRLISSKVHDGAS